MPRSSVQAVEDTVEDTSSVQGEETKRRRASGPRKERPIYMLLRVLGPDGQPIPGAKVEVSLATKDTEAILEQKTDDHHLAKVELPKAAAE